MLRIMVSSEKSQSEGLLSWISEVALIKAAVISFHKKRETAGGTVPVKQPGRWWGVDIDYKWASEGRSALTSH